MSKDIIKFLRQRDYNYIKDLGQGACGKTVLLYDDIINQHFVCKKYSPLNIDDKELYYKNFVDEIKFLHSVYHSNVVRIFNYYMYPNDLTGYILMEYIEGKSIDEYLRNQPESINEVFNQVIEGFAYLEDNRVLHRDIRPQNIMITEDGIVKIIDFGFSKNINKTCDFDKSITLNWGCEPPKEFENGIYDYQTEIYFIAKLFEKIINNEKIQSFKHKKILTYMLHSDPMSRVKTFSDIKGKLFSAQLEKNDFTQAEKKVYQAFASSLYKVIPKIEDNAKYLSEIDLILSKLEHLYTSVMLEEFIPANRYLISCFIDGNYYFSNRYFIEVSILISFIELLRSCSKGKKNVILHNLHSRMNSIKRYNEKMDDIPF